MRTILSVTSALLLLVTVSACGDKADEGCEDGAKQCSEDILQSCNDGGWEDEQDCALDGEICHSEGGAHCMPMGSM